MQLLVAGVWPRQRLEYQPMVEQNDRAGVGKRLKALREAAGISVEKMAEECGVSVQAVYKWFRHGTVAREHLPKLARMLRVSTDEILYGGGPPAAAPDEAETLRFLLAGVRKKFPTFDQQRQIAAVLKIHEWCQRNPSVPPSEALDLAGVLTE